MSFIKGLFGQKGFSSKSHVKPVSRSSVEFILDFNASSVRLVLTLISEIQ